MGPEKFEMMKTEWILIVDYEPLINLNSGKLPIIREIERSDNRG